MTPQEYQQHIQMLQQLRHHLLRRREKPGAATIAIDMELNIVRTELHASMPRCAFWAIVSDDYGATWMLLSLPASVRL